MPHYEFVLSVPANAMANEKMPTFLPAQREQLVNLFKTQVLRVLEGDPRSKFVLDLEKIRVEIKES